MLGNICKQTLSCWRLVFLQCVSRDLQSLRSALATTTADFSLYISFPGAYGRWHYSANRCAFMRPTISTVHAGTCSMQREVGNN